MAEQTTRRDFSKWLVTLTGAAVVPAIPAAASSTAPAHEDPAVLALGKKIDPLLNLYREAAAARVKARAEAEANMPQVPDELVCKMPLWAGCTNSECDIEGEEIIAPLVKGEDGKWYGRMARQILDSAKTKAAISRGNLIADRRTRFGKEVARKIALAERYESQRAEVLERSGLAQAAEREYRAAREIEELAYEARDLKPKTTAGVVVQARALLAYAQAEAVLSHYDGRSGQLIGGALARSLLVIGST